MLAKGLLVCLQPPELPQSLFVKEGFQGVENMGDTPKPPVRLRRTAPVSPAEAGNPERSPEGHALSWPQNPVREPKKGSVACGHQEVINPLTPSLGGWIYELGDTPKPSAKGLRPSARPCAANNPLSSALS